MVSGSHDVAEIAYLTLQETGLELVGDLETRGQGSGSYRPVDEAIMMQSLFPHT